MIAAAAPQTYQLARRPSHNVCSGANRALSIVHLSAAMTRSAPRMPRVLKMVMMTMGRSRGSVSTQMRWIIRSIHLPCQQHCQEDGEGVPCLKGMQQQQQQTNNNNNNSVHRRVRTCLSGVADVTTSFFCMQTLQLLARTARFEPCPAESLVCWLKICHEIFDPVFQH